MQLLFPTFKCFSLSFFSLSFKSPYSQKAGACHPYPPHKFQHTAHIFKPTKSTPVEILLSVTQLPPLCTKYYYEPVNNCSAWMWLTSWAINKLSLWNAVSIHILVLHMHFWCLKIGCNLDAFCCLRQKHNKWWMDKNEKIYVKKKTVLSIIQATDPSTPPSWLIVTWKNSYLTGKEKVQWDTGRLTINQPLSWVGSTLLSSCAPWQGRFKKLVLADF